MKKLIVWIIQLFLIWASVSQSFAESIPLLPPVDIEFIIAGLAHTESSLKSGTGQLKFSMANYFRKSGGDKEITIEKNRRKQKRTISSVEEFKKFAFSGTHSYFKKDNTEFVSDGNVQLVISPHGSITMYSEDVFPPEWLDPRDWGLRYKRQRLGDYLRQQKEVRFIGSEKVDGIPCYVIQMPDSRTEDAIVKFWIAPERGFRLVQILYKTNTRTDMTRIEWQEYHLEEGQVAFFPKRGVTIFTSEMEDEPSRNEVEITDFKPNVDVSPFFDLQIPPETEITNPSLNKPITFKEIGWKKLGESPKIKEGAQ